MELRDLEYFAVIARTRNLTRAAEVLDLSTPALSKSLRRLEGYIGAPVAVRAGRGVQLTAAGEALLGEVERLRLAMEDVRRRAADVAAGNVGNVRVAAGQIHDEQVALACAQLLAQSPGASVELVVITVDLAVDMLLQGKLDFIYNVLPQPRHAGTVHETLFQDELVVCASSKHPLARRKHLTLADVAGERWGLTSPELATRTAWRKAFADAGLPVPEIAAECRSLRGRLYIWSQTRLLGLTSRRLIEEVGNQFGLRVLPVPQLAQHRPVGLIFREKSYLPPAAARLADALRAPFASARGSRPRGPRAASARRA
jgi:DNA-binding transcriptional LysR family regulator